jgi:probable F420-dependent oxidoreductase
MRFGIAYANIGHFSTPDGAVALATAAEAAGFESLWTVEHVVVPHGYVSTYPYAPGGKMPGGEEFNLPEPLVWLTWVGAHTSTLRLGTGILVLPQRNPVILAKEVATLDVMSGGRVLLGVGVGWLEEEFAVIGASFSDRGRRTDEYVEAMRALWSQDMASFSGETVTFHEAILRPRPVAGGIPVIIGGHTRAAARRAGRLGDGFFPAKGDLPALLDELRAAAEGAGRDPAEVEVTWSGASVLAAGEQALDEVGKLAEMGVARLVIPPLAFDPAAVGDALAAFGENVIARS